MAEMRRGPVSLMAAAFILAAVLTSSQGGKPSATMGVPDVFGKATTHTPAPNTTTHSPNTTTHSPNTTTHTPAPNTTTHSPNTTTHTPAPNTTTHSPNTTTHSPNTTTHSPNTTTHSPNTTTAAPTTTPIPGPTPSTNLTVGNYTLKNGNDVCVMIQAAIKVYVNNSQNEGTFVVQPKGVSVTGNCQTNTAEIKLSFKEGFISLGFVKNDSLKTVYLNVVSVTLNYAFKSGVMHPVNKVNNTVHYFSMTPGNSYSCKSESVSLGDGIFLDFSQERCQAFNFKNNQFGPVDLCKADQPDYRVAVAVGVVLLILIVIVVIAYLISRRKRTDGYQTL